MIKKILVAVAILGLGFLPIDKAQTEDTTQYWMKIRANDKFQRSVIADTGVAIETVREDFVVALGNLKEKNAIEKLGWLETSFPLVQSLDFPNADMAYHNYARMKAELEKMHQNFPDITSLESIGQSHEKRDIFVLRISTRLSQADQKPAVIFMGGHHAREHLSVEIPLRFANHLLEQYKAGNQRIMNLIDSRDIHIIPAVNPDGLEFDVVTGRYKYWRKNRRDNGNGTAGVDLNRNYGYGWGTGGSSKNGSDDTYMGTAPFSEPETQAIKAYVEKHVNITILLSFHTFSELILYPWGHVYNPIGDKNDLAVHEVMAKRMAKWNGYKPEQSSSLYIASGDTTDWSYGEHKIFSFTFELDPSNNGGMGGFYPGAAAIAPTLQKNIEPCLYLLEYADNPYRVLNNVGIGSVR